MRHDQLEALADAMMDALAPTIDSLVKRMKALEEDETIAVVPIVDPHRQYPNGTFGVIKNGLWIFSITTGQWRCIANSVYDVKVTEAANGDVTFHFEMSNGLILSSTAKKAPQKKAATKPVSITKRTKPVSLAA